MALGSPCSLIVACWGGPNFRCRYGTKKAQRPPCGRRGRFIAATSLRAERQLDNDAIAQHRGLADGKTALTEHFPDLPGLPTGNVDLGASPQRNRSARIRASTLSVLIRA